MTNLVLGTAQFGSPYGVTNLQGRIENSEIINILGICSDLNIDVLDTSPNYGDAQIRLGECSNLISTRRPGFISKFSLPNSGSIDQGIFAQSLSELRTPMLEGLLFHNPLDLFDVRAKNAIEVMKEARELGIISRIGVSVYNINELSRAVSIFPDLDVIQIPANIFDLALLNSDLVADLFSSGVQVHVRSMFLQGVLLSQPGELPEYFEPLFPSLECLRDFEQQQGVNRMQLALGAIKQHPFVHSAIVGATSKNELIEIAKNWSEIPENLILPEIFPPLEILDPRNWPKGAK